MGKLRADNKINHLKGFDVAELARALSKVNMPLIKEEIAKSIKENVNGKIDAMRRENEEWHLERKETMVRILPVVEAFEEWQQDKATAQKGGKIVIWLAATITAIGGAYLVVLQVIRGG